MLLYGVHTSAQYIVCDLWIHNYRDDIMTHGSVRATKRNEKINFCI